MKRIALASLAMLIGLGATRMFAQEEIDPQFAYAAPTVVYEGPVVYQGPVIYQAPVVYAATPVYGTPLPEPLPVLEEIEPGVYTFSPKVIIIADPAIYQPCAYPFGYGCTPNVIYFGHRQACQQGYQFQYPR